MDYFDPETMFSYYTEESRIARKNRKCSECGEEIFPGNRYLHFRGILQRKWYVYDTCSKCKEDWEMAIDFEWTEGTIYGGLMDVIEEAIHEELVEKNDPLIQRWTPLIEKKQKELEQKRISCPLQAIGLK